MVKKSDLYEVDGDKIVRKNQICPRCGEGVFMADHGDRVACGKIGYTEMKKKNLLNINLFFFYLFLFLIITKKGFLWIILEMVVLRLG